MKSERETCSRAKESPSGSLMYPYRTPPPLAVTPDTSTPSQMSMRRTTLTLKALLGSTSVEGTSTSSSFFSGTHPFLFHLLPGL